MTRKLLLALLPIAMMAVVPPISGAKVGLKGDEKYTVAYNSYFPGGKTSTNETIPPRSFIMDCLNVAQSTVNRDWASVTFRYPWAVQHPAKCPRRFLANGLKVMYAGASRFWERTLEGSSDECPTYKPAWGPKLPGKVARDLFPDICH
jgi:hypothetical protein